MQEGAAAIPPFDLVYGLALALAANIVEGKQAAPQ
jgi:hypothetical protein